MKEVMTADVDTNVADEDAARSKITYIRLSLTGTETDEEGKKRIKWIDTTMTEVDE